MTEEEADAPQPCPIPNAHRRLIDCHEQWHAAERNYMEPEPFRMSLNNLLQNLRNVTWLLQKQKADLPSFETWYQQWRESVKDDPIMKWVVASRNRIVKEADLDLLSRANIRLSLDWLNEFAATWSMPPRYTTRQILIRLLSTQQIPSIGILTIQRQWFDTKLPDYELLDALTYGYERTASVIKVAHQQTNVTRCDLPLRPSCSVPSLTRSMACMLKRTEARQLSINLENRAEITEHAHLVSYEPAAAAERYGEMPMIGDAIGRIRPMLEMNKRMLAADKGLLTVAVFFKGDRLLDSMALEFADQSSKRVGLRRIADRVELLGADGLMFISETWLAAIGPDEDLRDPRTPPAGLRPNRMEAIQVLSITSDGRRADATCIFTRAPNGNIVFGETFYDIGEDANILDPSAGNGLRALMQASRISQGCDWLERFGGSCELCIRCQLGE